MPAGLMKNKNAMTNVIETAGVKPATDGALELVIVGSGLEASSQLAIRTAFSPFWVQAAEWRSKVDTVTGAKVARASRLLLRKIRVEAGHKKDELKADLLKQTRAIDGAYKAIESTVSLMEEKLEAVEKEEERKIAAAKAALKAERDSALRQYGVDTQWVQTGEMSDAQFLAMLEQAKTAHAAKIEAARLAKEKADAEAKAAAEAAAAKAKAEAEERERQRAENERLRKEAAEREAAAKIEREKLAAERAAVEAKARVEREAAEAKLAEERKARAEAEAKALAERRKVEAEAAAKLKAERDAREKLEREAAAARKAEADQIAAEKAAAARAAAAPDAQKLRVYGDALLAVACAELATDAARMAFDEIMIRLEREVAFIQRTAAELEATT